MTGLPVWLRRRVEDHEREEELRQVGEVRVRQVEVRVEQVEPALHHRRLVVEVLEVLRVLEPVLRALPERRHDQLLGELEHRVFAALQHVQVLPVEPVQEEVAAEPAVAAGGEEEVPVGGPDRGRGV